MNHEQAHPKLAPFYDRTLPETERRLVAYHVDACAECRSELEEWGKISRVLAQGKEVRVPENFSRAVMARLPRQEASRGWFSFKDIFAVPRWQVAVTLAALCTVSVYFTLNQWIENRDANPVLLAYQEGTGGQWIFTSKKIDKEDLLKAMVQKNTAEEDSEEPVHE